MQRKPGFPTANSCSIKMPDSMVVSETSEDEEPQQRRLQLINFGHSQWGLKNWSWSVTKQELDFVELINGKYSAGVASFVLVTVKSLDIHRENVGYATCSASSKGAAIHNARKCAVTNALRETLLGFGGNVTTELMEQLETSKPQIANVAPFPEPPQDNRHTEPKNSPQHIKKDPKECTIPIRPHPVAPIKNAVPNPVPPVAKAQPMPAALPCPANRPPLAANTPRPAPLIRPNSNDVKLEGMTEEEQRAERKRRQKVAQEEFRQKQLMKQKELDELPESIKENSSLDQLMLVLPSQGDVATGGKRRSPQPQEMAVKRRNVME